MFNAFRSANPPSSLAARQKYDSADVYDELCKIFFEKCYICETKEPHDINVEHFAPHKGDVYKKYDWCNLYLACSRCNNIKSAEFDDILDCCDIGVDVFRAIKHVPPVTPYAKSIRLEAMLTDARTINTCQLLDKVFNSEHTANKRVSGAFLRRKVFDQYNLLLDQIGAYYHPAATDLDKENALKRMSVLAERSSPYSAFIRWCIMDDEKLGSKLEEMMD